MLCKVQYCTCINVAIVCFALQPPASTEHTPHFTPELSSQHISGVGVAVAVAVAVALSPAEKWAEVSALWRLWRLQARQGRAGQGTDRFSRASQNPVLIFFSFCEDWELRVEGWMRPVGHTYIPTVRR